MQQFKYLVVLGASAGGLKIISDLFSKVDPHLDATYIVVLHVPKNADTDVLVKRIQKNTTIICTLVSDNTRLQRGTIYLAPANHHVSINGDSLILSNGPSENGWRPSIDVLFRSAAAEYNSRVIGIILTGLLDDGTSGMIAVKKCGGITIVQEPAEAEYDSMPKNVIKNVEVDFRVPVDDVPYILKDLDAKPAPLPKNVPPEISIEAAINNKMHTSITRLPEIGVHSNYTCPDCGGNLWKIKEKEISRYRCHTGHVYSARLLSKKQDENIEEALWTAIRMMEERKNLLQTNADSLIDVPTEKTSERGSVLIEEYKHHISILKDLLAALHKD